MLFPCVATSLRCLCDHFFSRVEPPCRSPASDRVSRPLALPSGLIYVFFHRLAWCMEQLWLMTPDEMTDFRFHFLKLTINEQQVPRFSITFRVRVVSYQLWGLIFLFGRQWVPVLHKSEAFGRSLNGTQRCRSHSSCNGTWR